MSIEFIRGGLLTTVQDGGRYGFQKHGLVVGGVMDPLAYRIANLLVGNRENEAVLEVTLVGPRMLFHKNIVIAICGGNLSPTVDGRCVPMWRPVLIKKGSILQFGKAKKGCRSYMAFSGGIHVPEVLGSRSTNLKAGIGGYAGRQLKDGDLLQLNTDEETIELQTKGNSPFIPAGWSVSTNVQPLYLPNVRMIKGPQFESFTEESIYAFLQEEFHISPQSDRMGYRLAGPTMKLRQPLEMTSEAVGAGTIQVPPAGQPIVLLADRQTTGGYPVIGYVATVDLPILAQLKPGDRVRFQEISLQAAQKEFIEQEQSIQTIRRGIKMNLGL